MRLIFLVLFLLAAPWGAGQAALNVPGHLIDPGRPAFDDPDTLVHDYLKAIDRGERVRTHSNLKEALPVPNQPDCTILSVSAVIEDGRIIETESHIWFGH